MKKNDFAIMKNEYTDSVRQIDESIAECRIALKKARESHRNTLVSKLNSNIAALYRQRRELLEISSRLEKYYNGQEDKIA